MVEKLSHKPPEPFDPFAGKPEAKRHFCRHLMPSHTCPSEACQKDFQAWLGKKDLVPLGTPVPGSANGPVTPPVVSPGPGLLPGCPPPQNLPYNPVVLFGTWNARMVDDIIALGIPPHHLSSAFTWYETYEGWPYWNWQSNQTSLTIDAEGRLRHYQNEYFSKGYHLKGGPNASSSTP